LTVAILLDLYEIVTSRSSGVFLLFELTVAIVIELYDHTAPSPTPSTHVGVFCCFVDVVCCCSCDILVVVLLVFFTV